MGPALVARVVWLVGVEVGLLGGRRDLHKRALCAAEAMRRAATRGKIVLLPSFHCRSMLEAAMFFAAEPRFYSVSPDLRSDFPSLNALAAIGAAPVAVVLTHCFGFSNDLDEAEAFCRRHGVALFEDCALFPDLPPGIVTYDFPLLLSEAEPGSGRLKAAGLPIWRWTGMDVTGGETARNCWLRLLQLPGHQGLSNKELEWMIRPVCVVVAEEHR